MRELINLFSNISVHTHVEMAKSWKQALMYCCKEESRISPQYYTDITNEIAPTVIPKLVQCKHKLDSGATMSSLVDDEQLFSSWVSHND